MITYEQITAITQTNTMLIALIIVWLVPLILYLIFASMISLRTSSGSKLKKKLIQSPATILVIASYFIQAGLFLIMFYYPVWAKLLN